MQVPHQKGIVYHVIDEKGIHIYDAKVSPVKNFTTPNKTDNVRSLLRVAEYYHSFVKVFASTASSLTHLLKKDVSFQWQDALNKVLMLLSMC